MTLYLAHYSYGSSVSIDKTTKRDAPSCFYLETFFRQQEQGRFDQTREAEPVELLEIMGRGEPENPGCRAVTVLAFAMDVCMVVCV